MRKYFWSIDTEVHEWKTDKIWHAILKTLPGFCQDIPYHSDLTQIRKQATETRFCCRINNVLVYKVTKYKIWEIYYIQKSSYHNLSRMLKSRIIGMLKTTCITVMYTCIKIGLCNTSVTFSEKQKYALQILI